jgi:hypothetical protein
MRQRHSRWSRRRHEVKEGHVVACGTDRAVSGSHAKVLLALNKICSCRLYIETILPLSPHVVSPTRSHLLLVPPIHISKYLFPLHLCLLPRAISSLAFKLSYDPSYLLIILYYPQLLSMLIGRLLIPPNLGAELGFKLNGVIANKSLLYHYLC